ncbi:MAG: YdcF family protein [Leptolyngbya sp. SIO1E4]|nr:YdcF family protein [Leptolyngbya sp. SIO1E4]
MVLTLLTRILVWAAVGLIIWYVLLRFIPRAFLTWFGGAIILTLIVLAFIDPNDETIGTIWKIISLPLTPLGATVGLLTFALVDGFKKVKGRQVAVALAILVVASVPLFARTLVNQAEQAVRVAYETQQGICADVCPADIPTDIPLSRVSLMVVLGENMDVVTPADDFPSRVDRGVEIDPVLVSRLNSSATLYQRLRQNGSNPSVLVTAGPVFGDDEEEAQKEQRLRQVLTAGGVPPEVIVIDDTGMDVRATVREVEDFLEERNLLTDDDVPQRNANRIALVAPAIAMRRTALTFENEGLQVVAWPTNLYGSSETTGDDDTLALLSDLVPSVEALRLTTRYWNEVLTSFYYFLRGWLPGFDVRWNEIVELVPE